MQVHVKCAKAVMFVWLVAGVPKVEEPSCVGPVLLLFCSQLQAPDSVLEGLVPSASPRC